MSAPTVVQTLIVELEGRSVQLEAALAKAQAKIAGFEKRLEGMALPAKKAGEAGTGMGVSFATAGDKIKLSALGIGAALLGIEVKATQMAAAVDGSLKQIGAASPALRANLRGVEDTINNVADAAGRDREEIRAAAEEIARLGVASKAEFDAKLKAATLVSDATGTQLTNAVQGVDELGDAFNLSADKIVDGVAKIYSASKGKVDFDSIFGALKASIPRIQELGLDFDTAIRATVALLDRGFPTKKISAYFTSHDAETIRHVASEAKIATGAVQELEEAAAFRRGGADREITRAVNEYKAALESLGRETLPFVTKELKGMAGILALIDGTMDKLRANSAVAILRQAGAIDPAKLPAASREKYQARVGGAAGAARDAFVGGNLDLAGMSLTELEQLRAGVEKYVASLRATSGPQNQFNAEMFKTKFGYAGLLDSLNQVITAQAKLATPGVAAAGGPGARGKPGSELTIAEKEKRNTFRSSAEAQIAALTPTKVDDLEQRIKKIRDDAKTVKGLLDSEVEEFVSRIRTAAGQSSAQQLAALHNDLGNAIAGLSDSQAAAFEAASIKLVADKRKELAAITSISAEERQAETARIDAYELQAKGAVTALKALEQLSKADREATAVLSHLDSQAALLQEREAQLTAVIENGATPRAERLQAERELKLVREAMIALSVQESAAVKAEIDRVSSAIEKLITLRDQLKAAHPDDKTVEVLTAQIVELEKTIDDLVLKLAKLGGTTVRTAKDANKEHEELIKKLQKQRQIIESCVGAALQLASAFGVVDDKTASVLQNIGNVAANAALAAAGDPTAIASVVASTVNVISSMIGRDPEEAARRRAAEENTKALLLVANSLDTMNKQLNVEKGIFGDKGSTDDLQRFIDKIIAKVPGFAQFTAGRDLTKPADRAAIVQAIRDYFGSPEGLEAARGPGAVFGGTFEPGSGMAGSDFVDAMVQLIAMLDEGQTGEPGTGGYNVSREITEVTGSRIAGLLTSGNIFGRRTAEGVEALVLYFTAANSLGPVRVPAVDFGQGRGASSGGPSITIETLNLQVTVPAGMSDEGATQLGAAVGAGMLQAIESIDQGIGLRMRRRNALRTVYLA